MPGTAGGLLEKNLNQHRFLPVTTKQRWIESWQRRMTIGFYPPADRSPPVAAEFSFQTACLIVA
jgi:hypothetical protein